MRREKRKRTVEADEFVLKDHAGNRRAVLKMGDHGPVFYMLDDDGGVRLTLSASDHGPYIEFFEPGTESIIEFGMSHTELHLHCTYRHDGISGGISVEVGDEDIGFYGEDGRLLYSIPVQRFVPPV